MSDLTQDVYRPRISVIICNYNYAQYIDDAITSALWQSYPNKEVIVVDDGSTDSSRRIIAQHADITPVFKLNGGQTSGVRAALPFVTGDIVLILDSDDYLLPGCLSRIAAIWTEETSLVQFQLIKIDNNNNPIGMFPDFPFVKDGHREYVLKYGFLPSSPTSGNAFSVPHVRDAFEHNIDRDRAYTDGYLIFTAPLNGSVRSINAALGVYRAHGKNVSMTSGRSLRSLRNQFQTNIYHRIGLSDSAKRLCGIQRTADDYLDGPVWRTALLVFKISPNDPVLRGRSRRYILNQLIRAFLRDPRFSLRVKLFNILGAVFIALAPPQIARAFVRS